MIFAFFSVTLAQNALPIVLYVWLCFTCLAYYWTIEGSSVFVIKHYTSLKSNVPIYNIQFTCVSSSGLCIHVDCVFKSVCFSFTLQNFFWTPRGSSAVLLQSSDNVTKWSCQEVGLWIVDYIHSLDGEWLSGSMRMLNRLLTTNTLCRNFWQVTQNLTWRKESSAKWLVWCNTAL